MREGVAAQVEKMNVESSNPVMKWADSEFNYQWADMKQLLKVGIINSNTMTAFAGFWVALYFTGSSLSEYWHMLLVTVIGTAFVIAGGCVLNNYFDRDIDNVMERTKGRPTVTGKIPVSHVIFMGVAFSVVGISILGLASIQTAVIGIIGWFSYVVLYTLWSKRKYTINTGIGSLSGAIPPLIGWSAVEPSLQPAAYVFFLLIFIWQTPHFLAIAIRKTEDYRAANIPMLPVVHGNEMTRRQMLIYILCLLPVPFFLYELGTVFMVICTLLNLGWIYLAITGYKKDVDFKKWANKMFGYSLLYLTLICIVMIVITLPTNLF